MKIVLYNRLDIASTPNIEITLMHTASSPSSLPLTHTHTMHTAMSPATTTTSVIEKFLSSAGQFASVTFKSTPAPAAKFKGTMLEKTTTGVFRSGVNFSNLSSVKAEFASGERTEVQPLAWGEWVKFPFVIAHKGERFLRLTTVKGVKSKSTFKVNSVEVTRDEFESFLVESARSGNKAPTEVFNIKEANLVSFNGEVSEAEVANG